jgi:RND family efflux transporter MFP subunit
MTLDRELLDSLKLDRAAAPDSRPRGWLGGRRWVAAAGLALLLLLALVLYRRPLLVETVTAQPPVGSGRAAVLNASGYVIARRTATIASKVTGRVIEVLTEEGRTVREDEVLARLDPTTVQAALRVAERQADAAQRNLAEIEVRLADAKKTLARDLHLKEQSLIAQSALDTAAADVDALAARLAATRADAAVAAATVRQRQQDLDDLTVRAPFAGVVIAKNAQPGEMVSPVSAGGGFTRTGIATVVDMGSREIEVDVNEAFIQRVHAGQAAEAVLDAYPDTVLPAHVLAIVPAADRQKATVKVRISFDALEPRILPDMGVKVRFLDETAGGVPPLAYLPKDAIERGRDGTRVWILHAGHLEARPVTLGRDDADPVGITAGLKPGEVVVARVIPGLAPGRRAQAKGS